MVYNHWKRCIKTSKLFLFPTATKTVLKSVDWSKNYAIVDVFSGWRLSATRPVTARLAAWRPNHESIDTQYRHFRLCHRASGAFNNSRACATGFILDPGKPVVTKEGINASADLGCSTGDRAEF